LLPSATAAARARANVEVGWVKATNWQPCVIGTLPCAYGMQGSMRGL
jgi:hypothetical protein